MKEMARKAWKLWVTQSPTLALMLGFEEIDERKGKEGEKFLTIMSL